MVNEDGEVSSNDVNEPCEQIWITLSFFSVSDTGHSKRKEIKIRAHSRGVEHIARNGMVLVDKWHNV